jgi:hypothetical protein
MGNPLIREKWKKQSLKPGMMALLKYSWSIRLSIPF